MLADAGMEERVDGAVDAIGHMIVTTEAFRGYFDVCRTHCGAELRDRILALYRCGMSSTRNGSALWRDHSCNARLRLGVGQIIAALIDGLSIQAALDPVALG